MACKFNHLSLNLWHVITHAWSNLISTNACTKSVGIDSLLSCSLPLFNRHSQLPHSLVTIMSTRAATPWHIICQTSNVNMLTLRDSLLQKNIFNKKGTWHSMYHAAEPITMCGLCCSFHSYEYSLSKLNRPSVIDKHYSRHLKTIWRIWVLKQCLDSHVWLPWNIYLVMMF